MNLQKAYEMFYESAKFHEYQLDPKTIEYDEEFQRQKKFSLLEKNGFIRLAKMGNKANKYN